MRKACSQSSMVADEIGSELAQERRQFRPSSIALVWPTSGPLTGRQVQFDRFALLALLVRDALVAAGPSMTLLWANAACKRRDKPNVWQRGKRLVFRRAFYVGIDGGTVALGRA
jgi:hypothetical protein